MINQRPLESSYFCELSMHARFQLPKKRAQNKIKLPGDPVSGGGGKKTKKYLHAIIFTIFPITFIYSLLSISHILA